MFTETVFTETAPPRPRAAASERRRLDRDMATALSEQRFTLDHQPIVALSSGAVVAQEAVLRWADRKRGVVPAAVLTAAAERSGLAPAVAEWTLRTACAAAAHRQGLGVSVSVALTALRRGALPGLVAAALSGSGLPPERLELNLPEALLADDGLETMLALSALRDCGVGLALEGFGAGQASLSRLKRFPFSTLKLHGSLIRDVLSDPEDAAIVHAILHSAHALGLRTAADGIETEAQRAFLAGIGCGFGQGLLFGRAQPAVARV